MAGESNLTGKNPYVGPRPFVVQERIFGRDREIAELDYFLSSERIVLLHSPSGAGKSSLVQAGLIPRLDPSAPVRWSGDIDSSSSMRLSARSQFDVWPPTRVNLALPEGFQPRNRYTWSAAAGFEQELPEGIRRTKEELGDATLKDYVAQRRRRKGAPASVLLVFDQFEEVLRVDPLDVDAKREFFDQLGDLLVDPLIWALFVIREDYLAPLDAYSRRVPTHLKNRYRIDRLTREAAVEAIENPTENNPRKYAAGVSGKLVSDLARVKIQQPDGSFREATGLHVEPLQLQVVCYGLWERMRPDDLSIDPDDLEQFGEVGKALSNYYASALRKVANGEETVERRIRDWFHGKLITAGGVRSQVLRGASSSEGLPNDLVAGLLDSYLVRAEQRAGATWYELAHDRLVEPIRVNNEQWLEEHLSLLQKRAVVWDTQGQPEGMLLLDDRLAAARHWADENSKALTDTERRFLEACQSREAIVRKERSWNRWIRALIGVVALFAVFAGIQWKLAADAKAEADVAKSRAEAALLMFSDQLAETQKQRGIATAAEDHAADAERSAQAAREARDKIFLGLLSTVIPFPLRDVLGKDAAAGAVEASPEWTPLIKKDGRDFAVARAFGEGAKGRIVAVGHDGFLKYRDQNGDALFLEVAMQWLRGEEEARVLISTGHVETFYLYSSRQETANLSTKIAQWGYSVGEISDLSDSAQLEQAGVLIIGNAWKSLTRSEVESVRRFVTEGGGLLTVGLGWSWQGYGPDGQPNRIALSLDDYPMNQLMEQFGVRWTGETISFPSN